MNNDGDNNKSETLGEIFDTIQDDLHSKGKQLIHSVFNNKTRNIILKCNKNEKHGEKQKLDMKSEENEYSKNTDNDIDSNGHNKQLSVSYEIAEEDINNMMLDIDEIEEETSNDGNQISAPIVFMNTDSTQL